MFGHASHTSRRTLLLTAAICLVLAVAMALLLPSFGRVTPRAKANGQLTGDKLAESMGLVKLAEKPDDCMNYVEVGDPAGYCIADIVHNFDESWRLGRLLRDMPIDDVEADIAALNEELSRTDSYSERYNELLMQIVALNQQYQAES